MKLFIVDEFCDAIREREPRKSDIFMFESRGEAGVYLLLRATKRVEDAKNTLRRAQARLRKCQIIATKGHDSGCLYSQAFGTNCSCGREAGREHTGNE